METEPLLAITGAILVMVVACEAVARLAAVAAKWLHIEQTTKTQAR